MSFSPVIGAFAIQRSSTSTSVVPATTSSAITPRSAMFRDQPTYVALKPVVSGILDGSAQPLATVRWPAGAKEPVIDAYDSKRLK